MAFVYILKCSDNSYYVGSAVNLERRLWEHETGFFKGYTSSRLPVKLVWSIESPTEHDVFLFEWQIKGWSRAKKDSLIRGDWNGIHEVVKSERKKCEAKKRSVTSKAHPSTSLRSAQDAR